MLHRCLGCLSKQLFGNIKGGETQSTVLLGCVVHIYIYLGNFRSRKSKLKEQLDNTLVVAARD